jgi:hypothetical protein
MTESRINIDDKTLRELYTKFQEHRRTLGVIYSNVPYHNFGDNGRFSGVGFLAATMASEHIITVTNTVNRFCFDLHALIYWSKLLESVSEDEKLMALIEFLIQVSNQCLAAPYLIKQTLIKSICKVSHQTNRLCVESQTENSLKPDKDLDFKQAAKLAKHFKSWQGMHDAFSLLNDEGFVTASDDYRNRFNHGFPRRIEHGHSMIIERVENAPQLDISNLIRTLESSSNELRPEISNMIATLKIIEENHRNLSSYKIVDAPPIYIANLIPALEKQYKAAVNCHAAYVDLIREQYAIWTSLPHG